MKFLDPSVRPVLTTVEAARLLNRAPQTLRRWSCYGCGPIRPVNVNGRLGWKTSEITALLQLGDTPREQPARDAEQAPARKRSRRREATAEAQG